MSLSKSYKKLALCGTLMSSFLGQSAFANDPLVAAANIYAETANNIKEREDGFAAASDTALSGMSFNEEASAAARERRRTRMAEFLAEAQKNDQSFIAKINELKTEDLLNSQSSILGPAPEQEYVNAFDAFINKAGIEDQLKPEFLSLKKTIIILKKLIVHLDKKSRESNSVEETKNIDESIRALNNLINSYKIKLYALKGAEKERQILISEIDQLDEKIIRSRDSTLVDNSKPKKVIGDSHGVISPQINTGN